MEKVIRERWARRSDEELLHAWYFDDLSAEGKRVIAGLIEERIGDLASYLARWAAVQGEPMGRLTAHRVEVDAAGLPAMRGAVVFAEHGVGFIPGGRHRELDDPGVALATRVTAGLLAGAVVGHVVGEVLRQQHRVPNRLRCNLPVPLLARMDDHALWIPTDQIDAVVWGPFGGEVWRGDRRWFAAELATDTEAAVAAWADLQELPLRSTSAAPRWA